MSGEFMGRISQLAFGAFAIMSAALPLQADGFTVHEGSVAHTVRSLEVLPFLSHTSNTLVVRGENEGGDRLFSLFPVSEDGALSDTPVQTILMPKDALFFDYAVLGATGQESLVFFDDAGVLAYSTEDGSTKRLIRSNSIYRHSVTPLFEKVDFARDLTGDGLADILLPDFGGYHLYVNDGKGGFKADIRLDMQVEMRLQSTANRYVDFPPYTATPRYTQFPVFSADANFDGLTDILFLKDHTFLVFHQKADGRFDGEPAVYPVDVPMTGNSFAEQLKAQERYEDQTSLLETTLRTFEDINGDNIPDMVTETDSAKGVFNRTTDFAFHYGYETNGKLAYGSMPDATIHLNGFAAGTRFEDIDGDGRKDFASGAVDIGIGKIISILFSGSAGVHVNFFRQGDDGSFQEKADYRKKISVDVNLSSGQSTVPVVELADIDGDGLRDLITSDDQKELRFYMAEKEGKDMFGKKAFEEKVFLPKDDDRVIAADVNRDGKADILIHYDRLGADGADYKNKFMLLVAK